MEDSQPITSWPAPSSKLSKRRWFLEGGLESFGTPVDVRDFLADQGAEVFLVWSVTITAGCAGEVCISGSSVDLLAMEGTWKLLETSINPISQQLFFWGVWVLMFMLLRCLVYFCCYCLYFILLLTITLKVTAYFSKSCLHYTVPAFILFRTSLLNSSSSGINFMFSISFPCADICLPI